MSGDAEQEYFADGIAEDLLTALSYDKNLAVVARNSTFAYKGAAINNRTIARELDSTHVVEGSVLRAGNRVRVTAQLIDTETGHHVWAERYDRDLDDIFDLQDELLDTIAAKLLGGHPDPRSRAKFNRVATEIESDPTGDDLDNGRLRCRVIGELLPLIESKHDHTNLIVSVEDSAQHPVDRYLYVSGKVDKHGDWRICGHDAHATEDRLGPDPDDGEPGGVSTRRGRTGTGAPC